MLGARVAACIRNGGQRLQASDWALEDPNYARRQSAHWYNDCAWVWFPGEVEALRWPGPGRARDGVAEKPGVGVGVAPSGESDPGRTGCAGCVG